MAKEESQATMRIDITPAMLEPLQQAPAPGGVRIPAHPPGGLNVPARPGVIRIPAGPAARPQGGEEFQVLLQSIYDAVFITDPQGAITGTNVRAEQFFACPRAEICKRNVLDWLCGAERSLLDTILGSLENNRFVLIQALCRRADETMFPTLLGLASPEEAYSFNFRQFLKEEALAADMLAAIQAGDTWTGELEMKRKDGAPFFAQASLEPNLNPDGAMTGIVISLLDVTPQRQAQQQLELYAAQLRQKNAEMEADLRMARDLQYAFMPSTYPVVVAGDPARPGRLEFAHVYHPSGLVGGDFFDILPVSAHQVLIFMADVMGHGARAALVVATIRGLLEQIAKETQEPGEFMTRLNAAYSKIFSSTSELMFATACCVSFDLERGRIQHANAGHPLPVVIGPDGAVRLAQLPAEGLGPALGLFGDARYSHVATELQPGARVVFFTDGLTEARNPQQEEFDVKGLQTYLAAHAGQPLQPLLEGLVRQVVEFTGTLVFEDDVCILGVGYAAG